MENSSPIKLSSEVLSLKNQIESFIKASPELWHSVSFSLNAAEVSLLSGLMPDEPTSTQVTSGAETTGASILEESYE